MEATLKAGLMECKTPKQVYALLKRLNLKVVKDTDLEWLECYGKDAVNLFLDNGSTRIHGNKKKGYKLQLLHKVEEKTVGKKIVPMCFGSKVEIDNTVLIHHEYNGVLA